MAYKVKQVATMLGVSRSDAAHLTINCLCWRRPQLNGYIHCRHCSSEARRCLSISFRPRGDIRVRSSLKNAASSNAAAIASIITKTAP